MTNSPADVAIEIGGGNDADYAQLELLAKEHNIRAEQCIAYANSQTAGIIKTISFAAKTYHAIATLISTFLKRNGKRLEVLHPDGKIIIENYSVEEIERLFKRGGYFFIRTMPKENGTIKGPEKK